MQTTEQVFLSPVALPNYTQLRGQAARDALSKLGLTYIHVGEDGLTVALCKETQPLHHHYVYTRPVPIK